MSTRLTYTSGTLDSEVDAEFEARLAEVRAEEASPLPHFVAGDEVDGGEPF